MGAARLAQKKKHIWGQQSFRVPFPPSQFLHLSVFLFLRLNSYIFPCSFSSVSILTSFRVPFPPSQFLHLSVFLFLRLNSYIFPCSFSSVSILTSYNSWGGGDDCKNLSWGKTYSVESRAHRRSLSGSTGDSSALITAVQQERMSAHVNKAKATAVSLAHGTPLTLFIFTSCNFSPCTVVMRESVITFYLILALGKKNDMTKNPK